MEGRLNGFVIAAWISNVAMLPIPPYTDKEENSHDNYLPWPQIKASVIINGQFTKNKYGFR